MGDGFTIEVIEVGAMDEEEFDTLSFETAAWDRGDRGFMIDGDNLRAVATGPFSRLQALRALRAVGAVMRQAGIPCERITHKNGAEFFTPVVTPVVTPVAG